jgi:hypothetical protein
VPPIPPIGDVSLFIDLWINVNISKANRKSQNPRFSIHEGDGDSNANYLARVELPNILGRHSPLLTIVLEHAKSNDLFARISEHYVLNKWVKSRPTKSKQWANIFEAWISCVALERALYGHSDPLVDVRRFLSQIWSIRYQRLSQFFIRPLFTNRNFIRTRSHDLKGIPISLDKDPIIDCQKIHYPSNLFDGVLGVMDQNQETKPTVRLVGFLATATIAKHDPAEETFKCCAFSANESEATEIARHRCYIGKPCCKICDPSLNMAYGITFAHGPKTALDTIRDEIFSTITSHLDKTRVKQKDNALTYLLEKMAEYFDSCLKSWFDKEIIALINYQQVSGPFSFPLHAFLFLLIYAHFLPLAL